MALFNFSKKNKMLEDFTCDITLNELAERLKLLYRNVEILDETTIRIPCFAADLRHHAGTPCFIIESMIPVFDNVMASDEDLYNYCNEMNEQLQVKVVLRKIEDVRVLFFEQMIMNLNKINITDINTILIAFMHVRDQGEMEFTNRFPAEEDKNKN